MVEYIHKQIVHDGRHAATVKELRKWLECHDDNVPVFINAIVHEKDGSIKEYETQFMGFDDTKYVDDERCIELLGRLIR